MRKSHGQGLVEWLRWVLFGTYVETSTQLKREIEELRQTLHDPAVLRPLLIEALHGQVKDTPVELAAVLMPLVNELLRQRNASNPPQSTRHYWPWLSVMTAAGVAALALTSWQGPAAVVSAATERAPASVVEHVAMPLDLILEERADGFGLCQATLTDEELSREVRTRLTACKELIAARVGFSVKDGWVWLRGEASASGSDAADRVLADLGEGVVLVNQLTVPDSTAMADH